MAQVHEKTIDFLRFQPEQPLDDGREVTSAENVLWSYTRAIDLLAEALQNATDAIDDRSLDEPGAPRKISIEIDRKARSFSVTDTGTGMPFKELEVVLAPNVTYKSGPSDKHPHRRSRGEKGVGLSFLVFACDRFELNTADGAKRHRAKVSGAYQWVASEGEATRPLAKVAEFSDLRPMLGSERYTHVSLARIATDVFDDDLFSLSDDELIWLIRTRTAVGNTNAVFRTLGRPKPDPIEVDLWTVSMDGKRSKKPRKIPYSYALPEDLLPSPLIVDFEDLDPDPGVQQNQLRGKALRYRKRVGRSDGRYVDVYFLVVDGRQMGQVVEKRREAGRYAPDDWTGLWLATRGMPANVQLKSGLISPRTYERRTFALLQWDDLKLDLGRKTVAGRTREMLHKVVRTEWEEIADAARRVQQATEGGQGEAIVKARLKGASRIPDLNGPMPYLKVPQNREGVAAVFHELVATPKSPINMYTLRTGIIGEDDELAYPAAPNGEPPLHVLYGPDLKDVLEQLRRDERLGETVRLAVIWSLGAAPVQVEAVDDEGPATHEALLYTTIDRLPLVVLESVIRRMEWS